MFQMATKDNRYLRLASRPTSLVLSLLTVSNEALLFPKIRLREKVKAVSVYKAIHSETSVITFLGISI